MGEIPATTFLNFFVYLLVPFALGFAAKKLRVSPIVGYLVGGVILGNLLQGLISEDLINNFAFFGIVLLLFTVGLDVNIDKLFLLKRFILVGGTVQIILSALLITFLSSFFGFTLLQSFLIALAFTSSSTSIVAKIIQDRGEENSFLGEVALGILMFQDLAFIPFIIIFTHFTSQVTSYVDVVKNIAFAVFEAAAILFAMYYLGKRIVPVVFNKIATTSRELLNLFIIIFIFMIASVSLSFGIPILVGAFIAGVLVSRTMEHYHIFSQIRPLRDLTAIIFFVYIGTHVKLPSIVPLLPTITLFSLGVILIKALVLMLVFLYFRFSSRLAFSLAIFLFQISENAFILMSLAFANGIFTSKEYLIVVTSVLLTLMATPFLINSKELMYQAIRGFFKKYIPAVELFVRHRLDFDQSPLDVFTIKDHVVICGYGRIGSFIGRSLNLANIPFIAIDYNFHTVEHVKKEGINIIFGDPTDIDVLDFAEVEHAAVLISAVPSNFDQESVILNAKKLNSKILIISRVHDMKDHQRVKDLGAGVVVHPELEASISILKKIFLLKKIPKEEIVRRIQHLRLIQAIS